VGEVNQAHGVLMQATKTKGASPSRVIRLPGVCDRVGASRSTIWRWVRDDASFPRPFKLSAGTTVWDEGEVSAWIEAKKAGRGAR